MERLTMTPFGRQPLSAGLVDVISASEKPVARQSIDKWQILNELRVCRRQFNINDRQLSVLQALLSFFPQDELSEGAQTCVFPSNKTLSERAHGIPESTLRRHIAALVASGLIQRHDSPNGKRYARRDSFGDIRHAFGFDLRPLLQHADKIIAAAQAERLQEAERKAMRERCVLACRDATKLIQYGMQTFPDATNWDELDDRLRLLQRALRRKLSLGDLQATYGSLATIVSTAKDATAPSETPKMSTCDVQNERHHIPQKKEQLDSEPPTPDAPKIPLDLVKRTCPTLQSYHNGTINSWTEFIQTADTVAPMMGLDKDIWTDAKDVLGAVDAAITVAAMLEKIDDIRNPGGYLRTLLQKAESGSFSPIPMVFALLNQKWKRAA